MLQETTAIETIRRYSAALRRITTAFNIEGKYHETITWFFVLLVEDRLAGSNDSTWEEFVAANRDLMDGSFDLLRRHYSDQRLWSRAARSRFVLPDRLTGGGDRQY